MHCIHKFGYFLANTAVLTLLTTGAFANTIHVPQDQPGIQAAINAAAAGDTIVVAPGTYHESLDWENKDLNLQGAGAAQSIIDPSSANGGPGGACLLIQNLTASSRVDGFTFQDGTNSFGGGVSNNGSNPTISNCTFTNNHGALGGGIYNTNSSPTILNCTFTNNTAQFGGGMYNNLSNSVVTNCILWGNSAPSGNGIYNSTGSPVVTFSDVQDLSNTTPDANGNFAADPLFVRNPGTNGANDYGDLHLHVGSPAIDAGKNAALPADTADLDHDGDTTEALPLDLDGNPRISHALIDLGAYEYQAPPTEVTGSISIKASGFTAAGGTNYTQTLTITNTGTSAINGPIYLLLDNLGGANVQLVNRSGTTLLLAPTGRPYLTLNGSLAAQGSVKVILKFSNPNRTLISCTPRLFAGTGSL